MIVYPKDVEIVYGDIDQKGLYLNIDNKDYIVINKNLNECDEKLTVAEEIAHYTVGVIPTPLFGSDYYTKSIHSKNEFKAFKWLQANLIPPDIENLKYTDIWELADKFEVTPEFIYKVIKYRKDNQ